MGHNKSDTGLNIMGGKTWNKQWINGGPTEQGGVGLDKDIVNMNENYINYIQSNPKLALSVEYLAVAGTRTTGHYLTLNLQCKKNKKVSIRSPSRCQMGKS